MPVIPIMIPTNVPVVHMSDVVSIIIDGGDDVVVALQISPFRNDILNANKLAVPINNSVHARGIAFPSTKLYTCGNAPCAS
jgi:hypothetical protein